ncbi:hypothetical protein HELRODRAFT_156424 [Helobdella robusta]|uniref:Armadillo repeat-containing domain-containing protein n=1 Tax=Helobdella robusta TaxID=6412 RepID=T1ELW2_HELRO|nr:hypothetical protein HELRODRAFT_156424 [Helobdella robusta]ESO09259.1 hypothetical protein HELRODRAFT_156424 [Helobdella robusta]
MASLKILIAISRYQPIWQCIINFGGVEILIELLNNISVPIRCLAAECLGAVAKTAKARSLIRQKNGIFKLHQYAITTPNKQWKRSIALAKSGAIVLSVLSNSRRTRKAMQLCNILPYLSRHLKSTDVVFLQSVVKIIGEFAKEQLYRSSILSENMIPLLVHALNYNDGLLSERVCKVFYRASEDERIRHEVFKEKGLVLMKKILDNCSLDDNTLLPIIKSVTGAISKLLLSPENVKVVSKLGISEILIPMMKSKSIKILLNVLNAFIEILKVPANRLEFSKNRGLHALLSLQSNTIPLVLILVNYALAQCAEEPSLINIIIENDGVRLLWSLLTHPNDEVKASAAVAICPCIKTAQDSGYMVRSLVSGLEILVKLLKSNNVNVLASVCATIANVVQDEENIGILTEFKVCYLLSKILCAPNTNTLQANLSQAIAQCCRFGNNREVFGKEDVVVHLVRYLDTDDYRIHKAAAQALYQLSLDPDNIIRMHAEGCVKPLLKLIGSSDEELQEAASQCVSNIRNLAFANSMAKNAKTTNKN